MKTTSLLAAMLLTLSPFVDHANATRVPHATPQHLVNDSAVILIGTVTALGYEYSRSGEPITTVRLQRLEAVTGKEELAPYLDRGLTLSLAGGLMKDGAFQEIAGLPTLELGHTYLLFLRGGDWTLSPFTGWTQGVFQIIAGPDRQRRLLTYEGQIVNGIRPDQFLTVPLLSPGSDRKRPPTDAQRGQLEISEGSLESAQPESTTQPIYREDNEKDLAEQDEKRAHARVTETKPVTAELLPQAKGAMTLESAVAALQDLDAKRAKRERLPLKLEPAAQPPDNAQQTAPPEKSR